MSALTIVLERRDRSGTGFCEKRDREREASDRPCRTVDRERDLDSIDRWINQSVVSFFAGSNTEFGHSVSETQSVSCKGRESESLARVLLPQGLALRRLSVLYCTVCISAGRVPSLSAKLYQF